MASAVMAPKKTLFERMKARPRDWSIGDVETVCSQCGLHCDKPSNGSHYKVYSDRLAVILTVPAARPIKPVYIRKLVSLIESHQVEMSKRMEGGK